MTRTLPLRLFARRRSPRPAPPRLRRSPRAAIRWFVASTLFLNVFAFAAMDVFWPRLRDPEYGRRAERLKQRVAENPGRPLVVVIGSSRAAMGVDPAAWEDVCPPGAPLLFNLSLVGSGPVQELMVLRRALADGVRPTVVLFEYWPPFLRQDGKHSEPGRIDHHRLYDADRQTIREFFPDPPTIESAMRDVRRSPLFENRHRWLAQSVPSWLPRTQRLDPSWQGLDPWGWLPGLDEDEQRATRLAGCEDFYREALGAFEVHPLSDRALRTAVAEARASGAAVGFVWLPEASEFRAWYPPAAEVAGREYARKLTAELGAPLIDARLWAADARLTDGFHLSRVGAAEFTRQLGAAVAAAFPGGRP